MKNHCLKQALTGHPCTKLPIRFIASFLFLLLWAPALIMAQNPPVNAYFDPGYFEDGDVIDLVVEYGDESNQLEDIVSVHFEIEYNGFEIDENSDLSLDAGGQSWFGWDNNYTEEVSVDHDLHLIIIDIDRDVEDPVSGYGYIARLKGIGVWIDEIHAKRDLAISKISADFTFKNKSLLSPSAVYFNAQTNALHIDTQLEGLWEKVELLDLSGKLVFSAPHGHNTMSVGHLPKQLYIVRLHGEDGIKSRKIALYP